MVKFLKLYEKIGIFIFLVAGSIFLSFASPHFLKGDTILNIIAQGTYGAIVGFGMTLAITLIPVVGIPLAILVSLIIASFVGLINGLIITKLEVNPLITTLAMMTIIRGVALIVAGGRQIVIHQKIFMEVGTGKILGVPNPIYIMIVLFIIFYFILYHTPFGRHISAVGSNENASRISGLKVDFIKVAVFVLVSFTAGVAGTVRTSQALIGIPTMSPGFVLVAITVTILGGTSLSGGRGNLWGTLFAGIFISMIYYGLNLIGVQIFYQMLVVGLVLIFALFIDGIRGRYLEVLKARGIKV
jgi:ribose transport system permease protein